MDGFFRRRLQRTCLPDFRGLELTDRFGQYLLHGTGCLDLVFTAGLHFDNSTHRGAQRENAQDIAGIGHALAGAQKNDGARFTHSSDKTGRDGGVYPGMGGNNNAGQLHRAINKDTRACPVVQKNTAMQLTARKQREPDLLAIPNKSPRWQDRDTRPG